MTTNPILQSHINKVTEMHQAYQMEHQRDISAEHERAEILRDAGASILNSIVDHKNQINNEGEALLHLFHEIGRDGLYGELGYGSLEDFVKTEYAQLPSEAYHYALRQFYAVDKLLLPVDFKQIPSIVTTDGEIITGQTILDSAAASTITRVAQMPEFEHMDENEKADVIQKIVDGVAREKIASEIRDSKRSGLKVTAYLVQNADGSQSLVFPCLDSRQVAYIQSNLQQQLNLILGGFDKQEWAQWLA